MLGGTPHSCARPIKLHFKEAQQLYTHFQEIMSCTAITGGSRQGSIDLKVQRITPTAMESKVHVTTVHWYLPAAVVSPQVVHGTVNVPSVRMLITPLRVPGLLPNTACTWHANA